MNIKLNVPYYNQMDNALWNGVHGNVQCAPTSNTMLAAYIIPGFVEDGITLRFKEPESYYKEEFLATGYTEADRGNHDAHTATLKRLGLETVWRTDLVRSDISESLVKRFPVVVGLEFKRDGHICIIVGETEEGFLIHDPYGVRQGSSNSYSHINYGDGDLLGSYDLYTWKTLDEILFVGGYAWGRLKKD